MKKNMNILATLVLAIGLMAPTGIQAGNDDPIRNAVAAGAVSAAINLGWQAGGALGRGFARIIEGHEGKILLGGAVALVAYYIYTNREESKADRNDRRAKSCGNKGCSHKGCK